MVEARSSTCAAGFCSAPTASFSKVCPAAIAPAAVNSSRRVDSMGKAPKGGMMRRDRQNADYMVSAEDTPQPGIGQVILVSCLTSTGCDRPFQKVSELLKFELGV